MRYILDNRVQVWLDGEGVYLGRTYLGRIYRSAKGHWRADFASGGMVDGESGHLSKRDLLQLLYDVYERKFG